MTQSAQKFNAASAALTITLASLASSTTAGWESTAVDITGISPIPDDIIISGKITVGTSPTANTFIGVYLYVSEDGTNYDGAATGSDAALTPTGGFTRLHLLEQIPVPSTSSNVTFRLKMHSLKSVLGALPRKFGIFVNNQSGVNLNSTAGNHSITWTPISVEGV